MPGGIVEEGESPLKGALRETKEEIGLSIKKPRLAGCFYIYDKKYDDEMILLYFYSEVLSQKMIKDIKIDNVEIIDYKFVDINELAKYNKRLHKRVKFLQKSKSPTYLESEIISQR